MSRLRTFAEVPAGTDPARRDGEAALNPLQGRRIQSRQKAEIEAKRRAFRASPEYMQQVDAEFRRLEEHLQPALRALQAAHPANAISMKRDELAIVVSALGYGLTLRWHRPPNTLRYACLFVTVWDRPVEGVGSMGDRPPKLLENQFAYDLADAGAAMWLAEDQRAHTAGELSEICLKYVIDRPRHSLFHWLHR